jgi:hypothetical protein
MIAARQVEAKMATNSAKGSGTREDPWVLTTPSGSSEYQMYRDETADPPVIVCVVGKTVLGYQLRAIEDLHDWLKEAWGRAPDNPVGGWYGLKKGLRGRFGMYMPPLLEALGLAEVEHNPRNNRMRAL